ncbi:hypothetical protein DESUT3_36830 [Desulfuromonas versatilis]|uniref:DUF2802 domain-containing protein n=1 Tax=Desulfuromonas versatilis TaxID=2802975 RepID=A0ABN6E358_9BACT|nr:hypothetical protein [Desulfuromonas versatilis]BCR06614.1 hypothetical protein DESUT3_36830 [Desulfuromonas versatilis]
MVGKDLLFLLLLALSLVLGLLCWRFDRRLARARGENARLARELAEARRLLEAAAALPEPPAPAPVKGSEAFSLNLDQANLRLRLQASGKGGEIPEKYRLVGAMARRGLSAEDIAEVLKISPGETEQLLRLAQVSKKG